MNEGHQPCGQKVSLKLFSTCVWRGRIRRGRVRVMKTRVNAAWGKGSEDQGQMTLGDRVWGTSYGFLQEEMVEPRPEG